MTRCPVHPSRVSSGSCARCDRAICEICSKWVEGNLFCTPCGVDAVRAMTFRAADRLRSAKPSRKREEIHVGKILFWALLLVGVAETNRRGLFLAARAQGARAVETAEGVARASDPRIGMASTELIAIRHLLEVHYVSRQAYPPDFASYLRENLRADLARDTSKDPWGRPYRFEARGESFVLRSDGPDKTSGTTDDLEVRGGG